MNYLFAILFTAIFTSCNNKKEDNPTGEINLKDGTWRVSFYWDQKDETSNFKDYAFMFGENGVLMAHKGAAMYTGTWSQTDTRLNLNFTDPVLSELNDNWLVSEKASNLIKLKDDNPAQNDQLHLAKN